MRKLSTNLFPLLIISVYFVQGAVGVSGMAEFLLTRNAFEFTWIQIAMLSSLTTITWSIKPLYGFLTDLVPIFNSRRRIYLIFSSIIAIIGYFLLGIFGTSFLPIALASIFTNIGLGFADVIVDGFIIESVDKKEVGKYQSICWRAKAFGIFFAAMFSGYILERKIFSSFFDTNSVLVTFLQKIFPTAFPGDLTLAGLNVIDIRFTFFAAGLLPIFTFLAAIFIKEKNAPKKEIEKARKEIPLKYILSSGVAMALTALSLIGLSILKTDILPFIKNDQLSSILVILIWSVWIYLYCSHLIKAKTATITLIWASVFLFLWRFTPSFGAPWSDYYLNTLKLSKEKLGLSSTITPIAWIIGTYFYSRFFDKLKIKKVLFYTVIISSCLYLTQLTLASPEIAEKLGNIFIIKYFSSIILFPANFFVYGFNAWNELMNQSSILNYEAFLSFFLEILFIISFLPLLKLAATVTPKGVEATNFAVLASVMNLGLAFGSISGGIIYTYIEGTYSISIPHFQFSIFNFQFSNNPQFLNQLSIGVLNFTGLHITIIIGALTSLICLPVLKKIKI